MIQFLATENATQLQQPRWYQEAGDPSASAADRYPVSTIPALALTRLPSDVEAHIALPKPAPAPTTTQTRHLQTTF